MKKFLISTLFIFALLPSLAQRSTITKFEGKPLAGLSISGPFDVRISQGENTSASIEISDDMSSKLTFELTDDNYLRISLGSAVGSLLTAQKNRAVATIVLSHLDYLHLSGAISLIGKGKFTSSGNCVLTISGTAFASFINVACTNATLSVSDAAKVEDFSLSVSSKLTSEISGSAKVAFAGSAPVCRIALSGTASLDMLRFACPQIQASATGTSLIKADVSGTADVTVGGLSAFKYTGSGTITGSGAKRL